jgi:signal transduction histidine kinase
MRSKFLDRMRRSLGFRLAVWYFIGFVLSSLAVSIVSYVFLSSSLQDNRKAIQKKLQEAAALAESRGIEAVEQAAEVRRRPSRRTAFFVRLVNPENRVVFINNPRLWQKFPVKSLVSRPVEGAWEYVPARGGGDVLEVTTAKLANGYQLQVGKTIEGREEILENYRNTITAVAIPMMLIALAGGTFFAIRGLRPVRHLIRTTRSIVATGRTDARVPESGSGDELDELTKLFNQMLERIESLIGGMKEALDNVAHDLRTPMTRLRGVAEMTLRSRSGADRHCEEALAGCVEESDRILKLLNSLMDISEAETGTLLLQFEAVNVLEIVQEVVGLYEYVAEDKNVSIAVACSSDLTLVADRSRLRQVIANLLDNAIKYNACGGRVSIKARKEPNEVVLVVEDNGMGIPADEIPRIWDRLHRGDESRSQPGLGLGLSLVKAIVHAHRGDIEVQSQPGVGSAFAVTLPTASPRPI